MLPTYAIDFLFFPDPINVFLLNFHLEKHNKEQLQYRPSLNRATHLKFYQNQTPQPKDLRYQKL